jgi:hypothetical protein
MVFFTFGRQEEAEGRSAVHRRGAKRRRSGFSVFLPINGRNNVPSGETPDGVRPFPHWIQPNTRKEREKDAKLDRPRQTRKSSELLRDLESPRFPIKQTGLASEIRVRVARSSFTKYVSYARIDLKAAGLT